MKRSGEDDLWMPKRPFKTPNAARSIHCGRSFSAVLGHDGQVFTWGSNLNGQLGLGRSVAESNRPMRVQWAPGFGTTRASKPGANSADLNQGIRVMVQMADGSSGAGSLGRVVKRRSSDGKYQIECDDGSKLDGVPRESLFPAESLRLKQLALGARHCVGITGSHAVVAWGWYVCLRGGGMGARGVGDGVVPTNRPSPFFPPPPWSPQTLTPRPLPLAPHPSPLDPRPNAHPTPLNPRSPLLPRPSPLAPRPSALTTAATRTGRSVQTRVWV